MPANKFSSSRHGSLPSLVGLGNSSTTLPQSPAPKRVAIAPTNATSKRTQARAGSQLQLSVAKPATKSRLDLLDHKLEDAAISQKAGRALDSSALEHGVGDRRSSLLAYADRSTDKRKKLRKIGTTNVNWSTAASLVNMPTLSNQDVEKISTMILKESGAQFTTIKQTIPGLKQSDLQQIVVLKPHQTRTSGMRLRYLKAVKLKV